MSVRHFDDDIAGTADAKGNVLLIWKGMTGQLGSVLLIVQALGGSPSWVVKVNGSPVNVGRGLNSPLRLPILRPGDGVTVVGTGIQPSTAVTGHFVGYAGDSLDELPIAPPEPSTIALDTSLQQSILAAITAPANTVVSRSVPLPAGAQAIGYIVTFVGFGNVSAINVSGDQTGKYYFSPTTIFGPPTDFQAVPVAVADTSVTVSVTAFPGNAAKVTFLVWGYNPTSFVQPQSGSVFTVQEGGSPPAWQAPNQLPAHIAVSIAAGTTSTIVLNSGGAITRRIFDFWLGIEGAATATPEVTVLAPAGGSGLSYHGFDFTNLPVAPWHPGGVPLQQSDGIALNNQDNSPHVVRGSLTWSST